MCEHCGCETFGPVRELHRDHLAILVACDYLSGALTTADPRAVRVAREVLVSLLNRHEHAEECGLYREVARLAPDYVAGLLAEHEEIGHLILSSVPDAAGVDALRRGIAELRQAHLHRGAGPLPLRSPDPEP